MTAVPRAKFTLGLCWRNPVVEVAGKSLPTAGIAVEMEGSKQHMHHPLSWMGHIYSR